MSSPDYTSQIMDRIGHAQMKPRSYFVWLNAARVFFIILFIGLMVISLSLFGHDLWRGYFLLGLNADTWPIFLRSSFVELILFSLLILGLILVIYRQTDWPMVRQLWLLMAGVGLFSLVFAAVVVYAAARDRTIEQWAADVENALEQLPYRMGDRQNVLQNLDHQQMFAGRVTAFQIENGRLNLIQIRDLSATRNFRWMAEDYQPRLNQTIIVRYSVEDGQNVVLDYKTSDKPNFSSQATPAPKPAVPVGYLPAAPSLRFA